MTEARPIGWCDARSGRIVLVVLAAGQSSRMGRQKLLLPMRDGVPMVRRVVETALGTHWALAEASLGRVSIGVTVNPASPSGHEIERILSDLPIHFVGNPRASEGMSTSLHAGVRFAMDARADAMVVLQGDQPGISSKVIDAVTDAYQRLHSAIVQARYRAGTGNAQGSRTVGHPVLFANSLFSELLQVEGDEGGRSVVALHRAAVHQVAVDEVLPPDIDTPDDYAGLVGET